MSAKPKICFIIPQFGILPNYVDFFILTASYLTNFIDFIFFTDQSVKDTSVSLNVFFKKMTLKEFTKLSQDKLKLNFSISNTYKLCDLKPMYGLIFEDFLTKYEYWGHCDFDIIFGDVEQLLKRNEFSKFDVFSTQQVYASGPFQIFRNTEKMKRFFMNSPSWQYVLTQPNYAGFDEAGDVIRELWKGKSIHEVSAKVHSITHLLKDEELLRKLQIEVCMKELITEKYIEGTTILFNRGKLSLQPANEELYIYHFMNLKNLTLFNDMLFNKNITTFAFSSNGFYTGNRIAFGAGLVYSVLKRYWIRLVRKKSNLK